MNFTSNAILFNMTNMAEPTNNSPEWIKILNKISATTNITVTKTPPDMTVWKFCDDPSENKWILNNDVLNALEIKNSALFAYRVIQGFGQKLNVQVNTRHYINIKNDEIDSFILKVSENEQQWYEWKDLPLRTINFSSGNSIIVTHGMDLQEKINANVDDFLQNNFESGHRLINKAGIIHPATSYGTGQIKQCVNTWFLNCWKNIMEHYKDELGHLIKYKFPTVTTEKDFNKVKSLINLALFTSPIYYEKIHTEQIPFWLVAKSAGIFNNNIINVISSISNITDFNKMSGEQQIKMVQKIDKGDNDNNNNLFCDIDEILNGAKLLSIELAQRFQPIEVITGVGTNIKSKKQINELIAIFESHDFNLDEILNMFSEDLVLIDDFCCPISGEIFNNPIMYDGHIYERACIEEWFKTSRSSPLTRRSHDINGKILELINPPTIFINALEKYKKNNK